MYKSISYAYATSTYAARFKRAQEGCYVVEVMPDWRNGAVSNVRGPFDTIEEAEQHALAITADWSPYSKRAAA